MFFFLSFHGCTKGARETACFEVNKHRLGSSVHLFGHHLGFRQSGSVGLSLRKWTAELVMCGGMEFEYEKIAEGKEEGSETVRVLCCVAWRPLLCTLAVAMTVTYAKVVRVSHKGIHYQEPITRSEQRSLFGWDIVFTDRVIFSFEFPAKNICFLSGKFKVQLAVNPIWRNALWIPTCNPATIQFFEFPLPSR